MCYHHDGTEFNSGNRLPTALAGYYVGQPTPLAAGPLVKPQRQFDTEIRALVSATNNVPVREVVQNPKPQIVG